MWNSEINLRLESYYKYVGLYDGITKRSVRTERINWQKIQEVISLFFLQN